MAAGPGAPGARGLFLSVKLPKLLGFLPNNFEAWPAADWPGSCLQEMRMMGKVIHN